MHVLKGIVKSFLTSRKGYNEENGCACLELIVELKTDSIFYA